MSGFLKPIDLTILDYFIRQGYPRELLFWLFTDSFELNPPGKFARLSTITHPDDLRLRSRQIRRHRCFIDWIHSRHSQWTDRRRKNTKAAVQHSDSGGSETQAPAAKPTTYTYARFCFSHVLAQQAQATRARIRQSRTSSTIDVASLMELHMGRSNAGLRNAGIRSRQPMTRRRIYFLLNLRMVRSSFRIIPRSAYGVFEFLGTLMKLQRDGWEPSAYLPDQRRPGRLSFHQTMGWDMPPPLATVHGRPKRSITIVQTRVENCFVHTWFNDGDYCVPERPRPPNESSACWRSSSRSRPRPAILSITPVVRVIQ